MKIEIKNKQKIILFNNKKIKQIVDFVFHNEFQLYHLKNIKINAPTFGGFIVYLINEKAMIDLNIKTFKKSYPTDVISFFYDNPPFSEENIFGEIFVSVEQALKFHKTYKTTIDFELLLYIIHGILHVFGYLDHNKKEKKKMRSRELFYMNLLENILPIQKIRG